MAADQGRNTETRNKLPERMGSRNHLKKEPRKANTNAHRLVLAIPRKNMMQVTLTTFLVQSTAANKNQRKKETESVLLVKAEANHRSFLTLRVHAVNRVNKVEENPNILILVITSTDLLNLF